MYYYLYASRGAPNIVHELDDINLKNIETVVVTREAAKHYYEVYLNEAIAIGSIEGSENLTKANIEKITRAYIEKCQHFDDLSIREQKRNNFGIVRKETGLDILRWLPSAFSDDYRQNLTQSL